MSADNAVASAAGPDCITFDVYKKAGDMVVDLFWEVTNAMIDGSDAPDDSFNVAFMVCLPSLVSYFCFIRFCSFCGFPFPHRAPRFVTVFTFVHTVRCPFIRSR